MKNMPRPFRPSAWRLLTRLSLWMITIVTHHSCLSEGADSAVVSVVGPISLFDKGGRFVWNAVLDRARGTASASETSIPPSSSRLLKTLEDAQGDTDFRNLSENLFNDYPQWLCRFPVTFGILKAIPHEGGYVIRDRLLGCTLLSFGKPGTKMLSVDVGTKNGTFHRSSQYTIYHPIAGGLLSLPATSSERKRQEPARIVCTLITCYPKGSPLNKNRYHSCSIETEVAGYRPWLAGCPPIHPVRASLYLCTQSVVHAYVTWRLHRRCWNYSVRKKSNTNNSPSKNER
jgi:hypothetical protein